MKMEVSIDKIHVPYVLKQREVVPYNETNPSRIFISQCIRRKKKCLRDAMLIFLAAVQEDFGSSIRRCRALTSRRARADQTNVRSVSLLLGSTTTQNRNLRLFLLDAFSLAFLWLSRTKLTPPNIGGKIAQTSPIVKASASNSATK